MSILSDSRLDPGVLRRCGAALGLRGRIFGAVGTCTCVCSERSEERDGLRGTGESGGGGYVVRRW